MKYFCFNTVLCFYSSILLTIAADYYSGYSNINNQHYSKYIPTFKIGYLVPEYFSSYALNNNLNASKCPESQSTVEYAIKYANQKLRTLYREYYGCDLDVNTASTKVN
jgi:hypothetical protein